MLLLLPLLLPPTLPIGVNDDDDPTKSPDVDRGDAFTDDPASPPGFVADNCDDPDSAAVDAAAAAAAAKGVSGIGRMVMHICVLCATPIEIVQKSRPQTFVGARDVQSL